MNSITPGREAFLAEVEESLKEMECRCLATRKCLEHIKREPEERVWWRSLALCVEGIGHQADDLAYVLRPPARRSLAEARDE